MAPVNPLARRKVEQTVRPAPDPLSQFVANVKGYTAERAHGGLTTMRNQPSQLETTMDAMGVPVSAAREGMGLAQLLTSGSGGLGQALGQLLWNNPGDQRPARLGDVAEMLTPIPGAEKVVKGVGLARGAANDLLRPRIARAAEEAAQVVAEAPKPAAPAPKVLYRGGAPFDPEHPGPTFFTEHQPAAESYRDMHNDRYSSPGVVQRAHVTIKNPAPEHVVKAEAQKLGIDTEADHNLTANAFHPDLYGSDSQALVSRLKSMGYDGTVLPDMSYGKYDNQLHPAHIPFDNASQVKILPEEQATIPTGPKAGFNTWQREGSNAKQMLPADWRPPSSDQGLWKMVERDPNSIDQAVKDTTADLSRRGLLKGLAGTAVATPFLAKIAEQAAPKAIEAAAPAAESAVTHGASYGAHMQAANRWQNVADMIDNGAPKAAIDQATIDAAEATHAAHNHSVLSAPDAFGTPEIGGHGVHLGYNDTGKDFANTILQNMDRHSPYMAARDAATLAEIHEGAAEEHMLYGNADEIHQNYSPEDAARANIGWGATGDSVASKVYGPNGGVVTTTFDPKSNQFVHTHTPWEGEPEESGRAEEW